MAPLTAQTDYSSIACPCNRANLVLGNLECTLSVHFFSISLYVFLKEFLTNFNFFFFFFAELYEGLEEHPKYDWRAQKRKKEVRQVWATKWRLRTRQRQTRMKSGACHSSEVTVQPRAPQTAFRELWAQELSCLGPSLPSHAFLKFILGARKT